MDLVDYEAGIGGREEHGEDSYEGEEADVEWGVIVWVGG